MPLNQTDLIKWYGTQKNVLYLVQYALKLELNYGANQITKYIVRILYIYRTAILGKEMKQGLMGMPNKSSKTNILGSQG